MKTCTKCRTPKPETDFNLKPLSTVKRYAECKTCACARMKRAAGGYDCGLDIDATWTAAEKIELADYVIGLWEKFKARASAKP